MVKFGSLRKAISTLQKEIEVLLAQAQLKGTMNTVREKEKILKKVNREGLARFAMVMWGVWSNRNQLTHSKTGRKPGEIIDWVAGLLEEFQGSQIALTSTFPPDISSSSSGWQPPPIGNLKLNSDAAVPLDGTSFGVGAVIRDAEGQVVVAMSLCL
ncbi:hypothetical protein Dsin_022784 [Dipteronia sinensis]|uniref:RNase H type-1 domain-containing protein n=1 Tax=Dipteronia sinensis TaxID=43782 RepID=A0AAE0A2A5_9ROSI|nr:hypothetical protein Dsin_022784 [Dipteronia sinensis]